MFDLCLTLVPKLIGLKDHFAISVAREENRLLLFDGQLHHAVIIIPQCSSRSNHHVERLLVFITS